MRLVDDPKRLYDKIRYEAPCCLTEEEIRKVLLDAAVELLKIQDKEQFRQSELDDLEGELTLKEDRIYDLENDKLDLTRQIEDMDDEIRNLKTHLREGIEFVQWRLTLTGTPKEESLGRSLLKILEYADKKYKKE